MKIGIYSITMHDGLGSYELTYAHDPYPFWKEDRRRFVVPAIRELAKVAGDYGITLAVQNHGQAARRPRLREVEVQGAEP